MHQSFDRLQVKGKINDAKVQRELWRLIKDGYELVGEYSEGYGYVSYCLEKPINVSSGRIEARTGSRYRT